MNERIKTLLLRAENIADPEASRETVELAFDPAFQGLLGNASMLVAHAEALVSDCHTDYIAECIYWGARPCHEAEDIQRYVIDPEALQRDIRIATSKNLYTKQSLKVALIVIERAFGSCYIPGMG